MEGDLRGEVGVGKGEISRQRETEPQLYHLKESFHCPGPAEGHDGLICVDVFQRLSGHVLYTGTTAMTHVTTAANS